MKRKYFRCALLELWSEGTAPFEFSQLLAYRAGESELVKKHLKGIENENLRNLIASMISRNPKERKSAEIYLDQERGRYVNTCPQCPFTSLFIIDPFIADYFRNISTHSCSHTCK